MPDINSHIHIEHIEEPDNGVGPKAERRPSS
jgi:hypothetical protein